MKWIFMPAIRLGNQLSFKYKFLLWSCLMLLPLAYSMTNLLGRLQDDNAQARKELAGVVKLAPLPAIEQALLTHRNLVTRHGYEQNPVDEEEVKAAPGPSMRAWPPLPPVDSKTPPSMPSPRAGPACKTRRWGSRWIRATCATTSC